MKNMFLIEYKVKGIKTLDQEVALSFYKKTIKYPIETQNYNIKGIYGMNGSGKSGIISSLDILKNLLINESYLNNPLVQKNLDEIVNKRTMNLCMNARFLVDIPNSSYIFQYEIELKKNRIGNYYIDYEKISMKNATSRNELDTILEVKNGEVIKLEKCEKEFKELFRRKTTNLLTSISSSALFINYIFDYETFKKDNSFLSTSLFVLFTFGKNIHVYMEDADNHTSYNLMRFIQNYDEDNNENTFFNSMIRNAIEMEKNSLVAFSIGPNIIREEQYPSFLKQVDRLKQFIQIFKSDLTDIIVDKKVDGDVFVCSLNMEYGDYCINTEYESTGIKKLIKLFTYIKEMVQGGIVFIDELDSNLHDVYLCALLEYLMDYGEGQLCFTTHNVGPMDILKRNKKSIDFLSEDHKIYSWRNNGHYSPTSLYKEGMIEGSPFNVDSIDFLGIFDSLGESD
ncbi:MAG: ATP-binding protein [Firmicutes bacterium]|nr:ATP-binding protein [Bacillota bacterium]